MSIIKTLRTQFLADNHQFEEEIQSHQDEIEQLKSQLEGVGEYCEQQSEMIILENLFYFLNS